MTYDAGTLDVDTEVYVFYGRHTPFGSDAVAKAKKRFADEYDVDYSEVVGRKINTGPYGSRDVGPMIMVVHKPPGVWTDAVPWK